jgi:uncharacterized protein (TIGR02246 family)
MSVSGRTTTLSVLALTLCAFTTVTAQAAKQQSSSGSVASVRSQIEAVNKKFVDLFNKGDVAGFAKVYAADATLLPPNAEAIHGQPKIAEYWQGGYKAGVRNVVLTTTEVEVHGNTAYEVGTASLEMHGADGAVVGKDSGKYIVIWKRSPGGQWQWYRDIWNSNLPASGAK